MAAIQQLQQTLDETIKVSVSYYYTPKFKIWNGYILKTEFKFSDKNFWKMIDMVIQHIKLNREYKKEIEKYIYHENCRSI